MTLLPALALAAGGARGAYQAGALLYLAEQGIRFQTLAGSSIGALNGAFYAQGDGSPGHLERLCEHWRQGARFRPLRLNPELLPALMGGKVWGGLAEAAWRLSTGSLSLLQLSPVAQLLDGWLDYDAIRCSPTRLILTAQRGQGPVADFFSGGGGPVSYFQAHELTGSELRTALLAATAIPLAFPSQQLRDGRYADAGLADPIPVRALYEAGHRDIHAIFLGQRPLLLPAQFPGAKLTALRPSQVIDGDLLSVFDFSVGTVEKLIGLGYRDAAHAHAPAERGA